MKQQYFGIYFVYLLSGSASIANMQIVIPIAIGRKPRNYKWGRFGFDRVALDM